MPGNETIQTLGSVGGPMLVVVGFLFLFLYLFIRKLDAIPPAIADAAENVARENRAQIDRLFAEHKQDNHEHLDQTRRLIDDHINLTRETVGAIKAVEKTVEGSTGTIRQVERRLEDLSVAVRSLEQLINPRQAQSQPQPPPSPSPPQPPAPPRPGTPDDPPGAGKGGPNP